MNKYIIVYEDKNTYNVLSKNELIDKFGIVIFHKLEDLVHGEFNICYYTAKVTVYDMITNSRFKSFKKELNSLNYLYKYEP